MSFTSEPSASETLLAGLPPVVRERVRPCSAGETTGAFVLVWMRTAVRAHENPALDAALLAADQLGLPVFVYHALSERYPYASDRHHRFILEGARDVAQQLADRGIGTAFHLERPGHRGPHLRTLAERSALVVTEDLPVPPLTDWTIALRNAVDTPVWVVDTACVLPMQLVDRGFDRAFAFRNQYRAPRAVRLKRAWRDHPVTRPHFVPADLPFTPVDLQNANLADLIAQCDIDHSVAPVPHTRGGTKAGRERWEAFRDGGGLERYASTRNAAQKDGTSRLSAYLHYGMLSPLRIARETAARIGRGPEKFLDELLIWRELSHAWCSHQSDLHNLEVLPDWAIESLEARQHDLRPRRFSLERMARGRTGDRLWDACQQSLLLHGELHNNVRMTWGKQLLQWTDGPEHAREVLVDLNHRYALDGRDPSSYGGLYWCLG
ncbi:MAG TPA: deoxyribodipyrimidine photolyase, partial [Deltaproteobacteria bacterium]|nr:deoxyribodipyrimidine photolyase [Deltaproteobacteria bacterium]